MILRRLALRNFLSYGDRVEPLDFSSLHVACLTGDNGHGKSALLDAMTWCLWGKARAGTDDLIRRGQTEMWVELEFELEGAVYRVIRKREVSRRTGVSDLQLQVLDPATGGFRALTGSGVRETEERVAQILRMDYDTFVNSAFLLQGRADEFTQRTPAERKRILGEMLSLGVFDQLEARARARRQEADQRLEHASRRIADLEQAARGRAEAEAERASREADLAALESALEADEAVLAEARAARARIEQAAAEARALADRIAEAERRAADALARAEREAARVRVYEATLAEAPAIEAGLARLRALRAEERAMAERLVRERELADRRTALERRVAEARSRIEVRRAQVLEALAGLRARLDEAEGLAAARPEIEGGVARLREAEREEARMAGRLEETLRLTEVARALEKQVEEAELAVRLERERLATRLAEATRRAEGLGPRRARLAALDRQLAALDEVAKRREQVFELGSGVKSRLEAIPGRLGRLGGEIGALETRISDLVRAEGDCPLCDQPLPPERRQAVVERLTHDELEPRRAERETIEKERPALEAEVRRLRDEYARLGRDLKARESVQEERSRVAAAVTEAEAAAKDLAALSARVAEVEAQLADGALVPEERAALADSRRALDGLGYDRAAHDALRERIASLRPFEARLARLEQASREADGLRAEVPPLEAEAADLERRLARGDFAGAERQELAALEAEAKALGYDARTHAALRARLAEHEPFEGRAAELAQAVREVTGARAAEAEARADADACRAEAARLEGERVARLAETARAAEVEAEASRLEGAIRARREEVGRAREALGRADARLAELTRAAEALEAARAEARQLAEARQTYADLARILGRNGVQAIIIENALPEIEEEANRLLGRLTDYGMQLKLETQRDKKTGGVAETLEIRVSDEQGTRPYETFSGGEAFRVNFALRIALSRLLARRAGARLQTLVIDEGFGTQDARGVQKLVEAIHAVEEDFAKVLVITHLDELKNHFPARIEVEKDPKGGGSTYRVV